MRLTDEDRMDESRQQVDRDKRIPIHHCNRGDSPAMAYWRERDRRYRAGIRVEAPVEHPPGGLLGHGEGEADHE